MENLGAMTTEELLDDITVPGTEKMYPADCRDDDAVAFADACFDIEMAARSNAALAAGEAAKTFFSF
jgi:hypothetical protein